MALVLSGNALRWTIIVATIVVAVFIWITRAIIVSNDSEGVKRLEEFLDKTTLHGIVMFGLVAIALCVQSS